VKTTLLVLIALFALFLWPTKSAKKGSLRAKFRGMTTYLVIAVAAIWLAQLIWLAADYFMK